METCSIEDLFQKKWKKEFEGKLANPGSPRKLPLKQRYGSRNLRDHGTLLPSFRSTYFVQKHSFKALGCCLY